MQSKDGRTHGVVLNSVINLQSNTPSWPWHRLYSRRIQMVQDDVEVVVAAKIMSGDNRSGIELLHSADDLLPLLKPLVALGVGHPYMKALYSSF